MNLKKGTVRSLVDEVLEHRGKERKYTIKFCDDAGVRTADVRNCPDDGSKLAAFYGPHCDSKASAYCKQLNASEPTASLSAFTITTRKVMTQFWYDIDCTPIGGETKTYARFHRRSDAEAYLKEMRETC